MADHSSRRRRRPGRSDDAEYETSTTDEEFPAAGEEGSGPIARELARRGLADVGDDEVDEEDYVEDVSGDGGFVFDAGDGSTGPVEAGETFVGELPLDDDEVSPPVDKTEILQVATGGHEEFAVLTIESADGNVADVEVTKDRFVLGRAPDCDLVIPDSLVSRAHAIIEERGDGWYLVDQNSGNGTFLNDERISDELLYDGDVFQIGDAYITFQAPGGAGAGLPKADATQMLPAASVGIEGTNVGLAGPPKKKKKTVLIVFAAVALLIGIGGIAFQMLKPKGPSPEEIAAEQARVAAAEEKQRRDDAFKKFTRVDELCKEDKWREALPLIQEVAQVLTDEKEVLAYQKTIEKEAAAAEALEKAREMVEKKQFEGALAALAAVPESSGQIQAARDLKKTIDDEHLNHLLDSARAAIVEKNYEQATAVSEEILRSFPDNEVAKEIREKAEKEQSRVAVRTPSSHKKRKRKVDNTPPPPPKAKYLLVGKALELYRSEQVDQALSQASTAGVSAEGVKILRRFQSFYKRGLEMSGNPSQSAQAIKFLTKALSLDKQLGGASGAITDNLRKKLAKVYFLQGVDAHTRNKYPLAFESLTKALKYNPGLDQAKKRIKDLEIEAKKLFETAYVIKGSSPEKAVTHCQTVTGMVNKSNIYYGKCQKLIAKIRGPLGETSGGDGF